MKYCVLKKDALTIAQFLLAHRKLSQVYYSSNSQDLRDLSRERESLAVMMVKSYFRKEVVEVWLTTNLQSEMILGVNDYGKKCAKEDNVRFFAISHFSPALRKA
jgi:hypothetical protein